MKQFAILYACVAAVMWPLDLIWLGLVATGLYRSELGDLLLPSPRLAPAVAFYVFYVAGIVVFAVLPAVRTGEWTTALMHGALFGFVAYATYDLTNLATLRGFSTTIALVDLAWGTAVTAVAAAGGLLLARALGALPAG